MVQIHLSFWSKDIMCEEMNTPDKIFHKEHFLNGKYQNYELFLPTGSPSPTDSTLPDHMIWWDLSQTRLLDEGSPETNKKPEA